MKKLPKYLRFLIIGLVLGLGVLGYCFRIMTLDLVKTANLTQTKKLEIWENDFNSENSDQVLRLETQDQETINKVVSSLNGNLIITPRSRCMNRYFLDFYLKGGSKIRLFYSCGEDMGSSISGNDDFFKGKDLKAPAKFGELVKSLVK